VVTGVGGGFFALGGAALTQWWTRSRDSEARTWSRRADVYVALLKWRLAPPDEVAIANPRDLAEAKQNWTEAAYPLLAELSLFGGPNLQDILNKTPYLHQAADALASMPPATLSWLAQKDLASRRRPNREAPKVPPRRRVRRVPDEEANLGA
jgi:hypothetical protein